jgi:hypothetical protein
MTTIYNHGDVMIYFVCSHPQPFPLWALRFRVMPIGTSCCGVWGGAGSRSRLVDPPIQSSYRMNTVTPSAVPTTARRHILLEDAAAPARPCAQLLTPSAVPTTTRRRILLEDAAAPTCPSKPDFPCPSSSAGQCQTWVPLNISTRGLRYPPR